MTYRRLRHLMLLVGTLMLIAVWSLSLVNVSEVIIVENISTRNFRLDGRLVNSTVTLEIQDMAAAAFYHFSSQPKSMFEDYADARLLPIGVFNFSKRPSGDPFLPDDHSIYQMCFPVWMPYLLFVAGGYALLMFVERRSMGMKEKALAAARDSGNPA